MQNNIISPKVTKQLDRMQRNFLWGSTIHQRKLHLINWALVTTPKKHGGLGIPKLKYKNLAILANLLWRYSNNPSTL